MDGAKLTEILSQPLPPDPMAYAVRRPRLEGREATAHWASSLAGTCMRQVWYRMRGVDPSDPAGLTQIQKMMSGEDDAITFVRRLQEYGPQNGISLGSVETEVPFELWAPGLELPIRGRLDIAFTLHVGGQAYRYGVEFKSTYLTGSVEMIGYMGRDGVWHEGDPLSRPSWIAQLWAYMRGLPEVADHWLLIVWDRGSRLHRSYVFRQFGERLLFRPLRRRPIELDAESWPVWVLAEGWEKYIQWASRGNGGTWRVVPFTWHDILRRLERLEWWLKRDEPPPRIDPVTGWEWKAVVKNGGFAPAPRNAPANEVWWQCGSKGKAYCEYARLCWGLRYEPVNPESLIAKFRESASQGEVTDEVGPGGSLGEDG